MSVESGNPRRIVTARRPDGKAYFARVEEASPTSNAALEGREVWRVWGANSLPVNLESASLWPQGAEPGPAGLEAFLSQLAPPGGVRATIVRYQPGWSDPVYAIESADVVFVLDGELVYTLDSGEEMIVRHGDVIVQNGIGKAWSNRSDRPAMIAALVMSATNKG